MDIKPRVQQIIEMHGVKCDLILMDNNVLASPDFPGIIEDIIACGFGKDNNVYHREINGKIRSKKRYVDFNQGVDARLLHAKPEFMELFGKIAIRPLRIAFDHADEEFVKIYTDCMRLAAKHHIKEMSNYILFNFDDTPAELYTRLEVNTKLNEEFQENGYSTRIWSFPMRYSPLFGDHAKDRKYVGQHWSRKQIRGVQCILNATHGIVGPKYNFFCRAFGSTVEAFQEILWMPERYIVQRKEHEESGETINWQELYRSLNIQELNEFHLQIEYNNFDQIYSSNPKILKLLEMYIVC